MITKQFREAVDNADLLSVHVMLKDSLLADSTFEIYEEMCGFAEMKLGSMLWNVSRLSMNYDISNISKEDLNIALSELVDNFSKDNVKLIQKMIQKLYPQTSSNVKKITKTVSKKTQKLQYLEKKLSQKKYELNTIVKEAERYHQVNAYRKINELALQISQICKECEEEILVMRSK